MNKISLLVLALLVISSGSFAQANLTKTPKGALYTILKAGNGTKVKEGDVITFQFIQKNDKDSLLGSSYTQGRPAMVQVQPSKNVADLMEVFSLLSVNDSALVRVPTDSIFVGHEEGRPPFLPKGSYLNFTIKVEKTQSLDEAMAERTAAQTALATKMRNAEASSVAKYLADNKFSPVTTTSGLKYVVTTHATGRKPLAGDTLLVNYTGRTLDGKVFDSSVEAVAKVSGLEQPGRTYEPFKFVVAHGDVIKGWDEGLLLMNEGAKNTFIIPSALAYGPTGAGQDIKPYSPLAFDIELIKIIKPVKKAVKAPVKGRKPAGKKVPVKKPVAKKKVTTK
jgi:FKBP-type peptidyl-prolyl cis-trans isomerase FkpA